VTSMLTDLGVPSHRIHTESMGDHAGGRPSGATPVMQRFLNATMALGCVSAVAVAVVRSLP
jgi:hypothetical protein